MTTPPYTPTTTTRPRHHMVETRNLCRAGIPNSLRPTVWRRLIYQKVHEARAIYGKYYYRNLCSIQESDAERMFSSNHQKQINLDLLRTMPNNIHFMSANCKGVSHLQQVLRAFCLHNGYLGYCQGMNFLAATALLFIGPEDAFWFLIAITEKYFDRSYFDGNLAGAQADQEVLKELLEIKYPSIASHLLSLDIDLATITLNWFIALFFDAVPFSLAFEDIGTLPSKEILRLKHHAYLKILNERLTKRQRTCNILTPENGSISSVDSDDLLISDIVMSEYETGVGFVVAGNSSHGFMGRIFIEKGRAEMKNMNIQFDCRVTSFVLVRKDMAFAGLISGYIVALHFEGIQGTILWEVKLPDTTLRLIYSVGKLFAALANGTLTVLENVEEKSPTCLELFHLPMGAAALSDAIVIGDEVWIATACKIILVDSSSLTTLSTFYVACSSAGGGTSFFEKV
uniref:Rab-GAP TBC domain-containing protein n=1 Tax=Heterorhabditis bacteriophora TaxID=37862 RepID=A0A1I7XHF6_HETBA